MKKLALGALFVGLMAACGGGGNDVVVVDTPVDQPTGPATCNPIAQTGCNANEKCTWIWDAVDPQDIGHTGCAALSGSEVAVGAECVDGRTMPGPMGFDNCVKGAVCISRVCKTICDQQAAQASSGCANTENCGTYSGIFEMGDATTAGACDPKCDVLNQNLLAGAGNTAACGSVDPAKPNVGCYVARRFSISSCAAVVEESILLNKDREAPFQENGNFFVNSCAPGYQVIVVGMTGSQTPICSGLCAAGEISTATPENDTGVDSATAKLVESAAPAVGDGLCVAAKKGSASGGPQNCVFLWPFSVNGMNVEIAPEYLDTLGMCFSFTQYQFDSDNNMTPDTNFPDCKTLPPTGPGDTDSADDFGCMTLANSMGFDSKPRVPAALKDIRAGLDDVKVAPHKLVKY